MKIGDIISIQKPFLTDTYETINGLDAEIIRITDKAIDIQWPESTEELIKTCKAWIPKSVIEILDNERTEYKNKTVTCYYIILPDWFKLGITYRAIKKSS